MKVALRKISSKYIFIYTQWHGNIARQCGRGASKWLKARLHGAVMVGFAVCGTVQGMLQSCCYDDGWSLEAAGREGILTAVD